MVFYGLDDVALDVADDDAYDLVVAEASGQIEYEAVARRFAARRGRRR